MQRGLGVTAGECRVEIGAARNERKHGGYIVRKMAGPIGSHMEQGARASHPGFRQVRPGAKNSPQRFDIAALNRLDGLGCHRVVRLEVSCLHWFHDTENLRLEAGYPVLRT